MLNVVVQGTSRAVCVWGCRFDFAAQGWAQLSQNSCLSVTIPLPDPRFHILNIWQSHSFARTLSWFYSKQNFVCISLIRARAFLKYLHLISSASTQFFLRFASSYHVHLFFSSLKIATILQISSFLIGMKTSMVHEVLVCNGSKNLDYGLLVVMAV